MTTVAQLYAGLFDELHDMGAAVSNIATELERISPDHAQRLHTIAATAVRMAVIRPTLHPSNLTLSVNVPLQSFLNHQPYDVT